MTAVRTATRFDEDAALAVWRAACDVRGRPPSNARVARVRAKLRAPDALALVAEDDGAVTGMLLAELARADDGEGAVVPGALHLSMLFVHPTRWRRGVGAALLTSLVGRYPCVSVWTTEDNTAARSLYTAAGFLGSGERQSLPVGDVLRLEHR